MELDTGSVTWILVATALVIFMVPGLALFYGGMVRSKNVLNMLLMNMYCLGIVPVVWVFAGYTLSTQEGGVEGFLGSFDALGMSGVDNDQLLFAFFAMAFAIITPALISGAVADRLSFRAWAIFVPVWALIVYAPVFYWIYGPDGWLLERGSLDFAGGTAIHVNAGVAALAFVLVLGKRAGWPREIMPPHNLPLVLIGTGVLWFGWFGFNAGSALEANGQAVQAFMNTLIAPAAAMLTWLVAETVKDGKPTTLGAASGVVGGLVAITPAAGYVDTLPAMAIGAVAGVLCFLAISLKYRLGYDDSLDVVGVHLVGGIIGGLLVGVFADPSAVPGGEFVAGLTAGGGPELLIEQALSIAVVMVYSFVLTYGLAQLLKVTVGIRVDETTESTGLDQMEHAESAYNLGETGALRR